MSRRRLVLIAAVAVAVIVALAIGLAIADFHDPATVDTPTKTCEPIGAKHPKAHSAECKP